jgi:RNA polymerase sigma factor (sigma-70 family)
MTPAQLTPADVKWAHRYVARLWRRYPHLEDDIKSEATVGLVLAASAYRPLDDSSSFRAYARLRVWGAAIDYLRGRMGRRLNGPLKTLHISDREWVDIEAEREDLDETIDQQRALEALDAEIDTLPPRTAAIMRARFFEHREQREIGRDLGVTESRICQIVLESAKKLAARDPIRAIREAA